VPALLPRQKKQCGTEGKKFEVDTIIKKCTAASSPKVNGNASKQKERVVHTPFAFNVRKKRWFVNTSALRHILQECNMNSPRLFLFIFFVLAIPTFSFSQTVPLRTSEDTLNSALSSANATVVGGYGNAVYQNDFNAKTSTVDLERVVLFVGHTYGDISFCSELEMEDAKVSGDKNGGEIAFEQAYLKFNLDQNHYIAAGLFLPRIGILNENHLPMEFNGNERTQTETFIFPST